YSRGLTSGPASLHGRDGGWRLRFQKGSTDGQVGLQNPRSPRVLPGLGISLQWDRPQPRDFRATPRHYAATPKCPLERALDSECPWRLQVGAVEVPGGSK